MKNWDLKIQFKYKTADRSENGFKLWKFIEHEKGEGDNWFSLQIWSI